MDVFEAIKGRRTIRHFTEKPVPEDIFKKIIDAARWAPSACNRQGWRFIVIKNKACGFAYRTSRFKTIDKGRYIITSVTLRLNKTAPSPPFYESLEKYLKEHKIKDYTPRAIREAVIAIRAVKLPSPARVANNGSFFTNPIIDKSQFEKLQKQYPDVKGWPHGDNVKVSAGWLLEKAGFKGVHDKETGMATWPAQALVLINEHAKNTADLLAFMSASFLQDLLICSKLVKVPPNQRSLT